MTANAITSTVLIVHKSSNGLRLDYVDKLEADTTVAIRLDNGRTLSGHVLWRVGRHAGIKFRRRLKANDPLLTGL